MVFGDNAAATFPGRDAIPVFTDVTAYDEFYRTDCSSDDDTAIRRVYRALHEAGTAYTITVGKTVKVLGEQRDPESKNYDICRISYDGKTGYVVCIALGN
jgi:hypothetical protein